MAQPIHGLPGRPRQQQYGWEQSIKSIFIRQVAYTKWKGIKEEKTSTRKSAIRSTPWKVDGMLLQHYVHLFAICSGQRLSQGITLWFTHASIVPVAIFLEIT